MCTPGGTKVHETKRGSTRYVEGQGVKRDQRGIKKRNRWMNMIKVHTCMEMS
jgi:hypothetical protein